MSSHVNKRKTKSQCSIVGCTEGKPGFIVRDLCRRHLHALKTWGDPLLARAKGDHTTHGMTKTPEWYVWTHMRSRCNVPTHPAYKDYGERGINVCERWSTFENFFADMGLRPSPKHTIERVDNDGNYEPENCKWATRQEQNTNARSNRYLTAFGRTQTLTQWGRDVGLSASCLTYRLDVLRLSPDAVLNPTLIVPDKSAAIHRGRTKRDNNSGYFGVHWHGANRKRQVRIRHQGKVYYQGFFVSPVDAANAYDSKAKELYGTAAVVNFGLETGVDV